MNTKRNFAPSIPAKAIPIALSREEREFAAERSKIDPLQHDKSSENCSYIGVLGEVAWCIYRYGRANWKAHALNIKHGNVDDNDPLLSVEIKASKVANPGRCKLLVKEAYAKARRPDVYTQIFFLSSEPDFAETIAYVMGYASHAAVIAAPLERLWIAKLQKYQDYLTHAISVEDLLPWPPEPFDP